MREMSILLYSDPSFLFQAQHRTQVEPVKTLEAVLQDVDAACEHAFAYLCCG